MDTVENVEDLEVGSALIAALRRRDFQAMAALLTPDCRFRALVPGRAVDGNGPAVLAAALTGWFGGADSFVVEQATVGRVGSRTYLRWRVRLASGHGTTWIAEQHAFATVDGGIRQLDLMCSGFLPAGEPDT